jgi:hypothetical protein
MTFITVLTALGILLAGAIVAVAFILIDLCRKNPTPDDEFPRSRWEDRK